MKLKLLAAMPLIAISIGALAACGQPAQSHPPETTSQIVHQLVACVRSHGYPNLPDPTFDSQGRPQFPPGTDVPKQAPLACQSIFNRLPASMRNGASAPDIQTAIKFAQCMRSHGLTDWPDPDADGSYPLPPDLRAGSKSGPLWDRIKTGWDACRAFNPSGSISVSHG